jgi:phosphate transport system substrate-binding protein
MKTLLLSILFLAIPVAYSQARDAVTVVGSSTVYPFTTVVAESLGKQGFKTPKVESTGTGGGIKMFCSGVGTQYPDAVNASRRMKKGEFDSCVKNGVSEIIEIEIGFDGLTLAGNKNSKLNSLTAKQIYLALAKQVPDSKGNFVANPYKTWNQIDPSLPNIRIEVLGPPPTSGTRDSFHELYMEHGCSTFEFIKALKSSDEKAFKKVCHTIREDGHFVEAGENDNLIVQKLNSSNNALGIFGYSFLEENLARVKGMKIDGISPTYETISNGEFSAARPLYVYVKKAHLNVIPGLKNFMQEYVSEKAIGDEGYLTERGLVTLPPARLKSSRERVAKLANFKP